MLTKEASREGTSFVNIYRGTKHQDNRLKQYIISLILLQKLNRLTCMYGRSFW